MNLLQYNVNVQPIRTDGDIKVLQNCNGFSAINKGDVVVRVNGFPLDPPAGAVSGEAIEFGGNYGEVFTGVINVSFTAGGVNPLVFIIQKVYKC
jgi:hypothetical protein